MNKQEFIDALRNELSGFPREDVDERIGFYIEMIDDRIEEGLREEEAVAALGSIEKIAAQITSDIPLAKIAKEKVKAKRELKVWEIVLLAVGSPVWVPLAIAAVVVALSVYIVIWSVVISIFAVHVSLVACSPVALAWGIACICRGGVAFGIAMIGAAIFCAGLAIFLFFGGRESARGTVFLAKKVILGTKKCFAGKEKAR